MTLNTQEKAPPRQADESSIEKGESPPLLPSGPPPVVVVVSWSFESTAYAFTAITSILGIILIWNPYVFQILQLSRFSKYSEYQDEAFQNMALSVSSPVLSYAHMHQLPGLMTRRD